MIKYIMLIVLIYSFSASAFSSSRIVKNFCTDGCTSVNDLDPEFIHCCVSHDLAYYKGGTIQEKDKADASLRVCIQQSTSGFDLFSSSFGVATTDFGGEGETGWGYGWGSTRPSKYHNTLSEEELVIYKESVSKQNLNFIEFDPIRLAKLKYDNSYMQKIYSLKCN